MIKYAKHINKRKTRVVGISTKGQRWVFETIPGGKPNVFLGPRAIFFGEGRLKTPGGNSDGFTCIGLNGIGASQPFFY